MSMHGEHTKRTGIVMTTGRDLASKYKLKVPKTKEAAVYLIGYDKGYKAARAKTITICLLVVILSAMTLLPFIKI